MTSQITGYSAKVSLKLHVNGTVLDVSHLGPERCIVRDPQDLPPGDARIVVNIDDYQRSDDVYLLDGVSGDSNVVRYRDKPVD